MASITIQVPDEEALEYDLDAIEQLTIGRGPDNDVVLEHASMSGSHATIQNLGGTFQLRDLGSTNGTFVNGTQIDEVTLESGAQVEFGKVQAVFADGEISEEEVEPEGEPEASDEGAVGEGDDQEVYAVEIAEVSKRPSNFKDLSPIEKVEKKNSLGQVAVLIGVVAILAAIALIVISTTMMSA